MSANKAQIAALGALAMGALWAGARAATATSAAPQATVERELYLLGTTVSLAASAADRATAARAAEAAVRALEATESRLSTWRADSELMRLSRAPVGVAVP